LKRDTFVSVTDAYISKIPQSEPQVNALNNSMVCVMLFNL